MLEVRGERTLEEMSRRPWSLMMVFGTVCLVLVAEVLEKEYKFEIAGVWLGYGGGKKTNSGLHILFTNATAAAPHDMT